MDLQDIENLVKLMDDEGLSLIKIEDGKTKVELSRQATTAVSAATIAPVTTALAATAPTKENESTPEPEGPTIASPMTGTFYAAPSPEDPPFVKVGDTVSVGDVVCIVEAMKTFNRLESELSGTVAKMLVATGDPVEEGQPLILLK